MSKMSKHTLLCLSFLALSQSALAQEKPATSFMQDVSVGLTAGLGGVGLELSKPLSEHLAVRIGHSTGSTSYTLERRKIQYDSTINLGGTSLLADYHPWKNGGFKLTAGAYLPDFSASGSANLSAGSLIINGTSYSLAEIGALSADIAFSSGLKPYLGLGYSKGNQQSGWFISADAGLIFSGSPTLSLNAQCTSSLELLCTQLNQNVAAERSKVQDSLDKFNILPMVQMSVSYRF